MNISKANLGQLQYIIRYTDLKIAAIDELLRRMDLAASYNSQTKEA